MTISRILLISQLFPPAENPRAFRWGALANIWQQQGHQVDIVCGKMGRGTANVATGINIYAVGLPPLRNYGPSPYSQQQSKGIWSKQAAVLRRLHDRIWLPMRWPDHACVWIGFAARKAHKLLETQRYDVIVSVSNPFSSHVAALLARSCKGAQRVPWLCDIGDPFSLTSDEPANNLSLYGRLNPKVERYVLNQSHAITVTTPTTADLYGNSFPEIAPKIHVIGPLLSIAMQPAVAKPTPYKTRRHLVFSGMLLKTTRNPRPLLRLFRLLLKEPEFSDLELHFYGRIGGCRDEFDGYRDLLNQRLHLHGQVPRETAIAAMQQAHALVNLGNTNPYQLPSKLVEYVSVGKPIINFATHENDASKKFLTDYPSTLSLSFANLSRPSPNYRQLISFLRNPPTVSRSAIDALLTPYQGPAISTAYHHVIEKISE